MLRSTDIRVPRVLLTKFTFTILLLLLPVGPLSLLASRFSTLVHPTLGLGPSPPGVPLRRG